MKYCTIYTHRIQGTKHWKPTGDQEKLTIHLLTHWTLTTPPHFQELSKQTKNSDPSLNDDTWVSIEYCTVTMVNAIKDLFKAFPHAQSITNDHGFQRNDAILAGWWSSCSTKRRQWIIRPLMRAVYMSYKRFLVLRRHGIQALNGTSNYRGGMLSIKVKFDVDWSLTTHSFDSSILVARCARPSCVSFISLGLCFLVYRPQALKMPSDILGPCGSGVVS